MKEARVTDRHTLLFVALRSETMARILVLIAACVLLAGCGGLLESDGPPRTQWWLEPASISAPPQRLVIDVTVIPGLDTDRILNLDDRSQLNNYAGAHWPDHLPEVLGSLVVRSFGSGDGVSVRPGERAADGECLLRLEFRSFFGRIDSAGVTRRVEVDVAGTLVCPEKQQSLAASRSIPVGENRMASIVGAFQSGFEGTLQDLSSQLASP